MFIATLINTRSLVLRTRTASRFAVFFRFARAPRS